MFALDLVIFAATFIIALNQIIVGWKVLPNLPTSIIMINLVVTVAVASGLGYVGFNFACLGVLLAGSTRVAMLGMANSQIAE